MNNAESIDTELLVVGAGPAGLTTARTAALAGRRVVVVDSGPADRSAGGSALLSPAAVTTLDAIGTLPSDAHCVAHVRFTSGDSSVSTPWPGHPGRPDHGVVVDRRTLDTGFTRAAVAAGADVRFDHEATSAVVERGFVRGANLVRSDGTRLEIRADLVVVADGANSRFGRVLGSARDPGHPFAVAHHTTFHSALHDASEIEIVVGATDQKGTPITGYGWMFPTGRGTVDVGIVLMSTSPSFQVLNPAHVLDQLLADHGHRWHLLDGGTDPTGGRIPLGRSVGPAAGPTWLLVGDAAGLADPWSAAGLEAAVVSGRMAGEVVVEALDSRSSLPLQQYPRRLEDHFEPGYRVGRLADRLLGRPVVNRRLARALPRSERVADSTLRLVTGALRPGHTGPAEVAFRVARTLGVVLPGF